MRLNRFSLHLLLSTALAAVPVSQFAKAEPPARSKPIPHSVGIFLTKSGQDTLFQSIQTILKSMDVDLSQGRVDEISEKLTTPFTVARIKKMLAGRKGGEKAAETFEVFCDLFRAWLKGFKVKAPLISFKVQGLEYQLQFDRLGFQLDPAATLRSGPASMAFEFVASIKSARVDVKKIRVEDRANAFLNPLGLNDPSMVMPSFSPPLTINLPFVLRSKDGKVSVEFFPGRSNLANVLLDLRFGQLELPEIALTLSDPTDPNDVPTKILLSKAGLNREIQKIEPDLIKAIHTAAAGFINNELHEQLNEMAEAKLASFLDMKPFAFPAPGEPAKELKTEKDVPFDFRIFPGEIERIFDWRSEALYFSAQTQIDDPVASVTTQPISRFPSKRPEIPRSVTTTGKNAPQAWVSVNEALLNRALRLSFDRGYNKSIPIGGGFFIVMNEAPRILLDGRLGPDRAVMRINAKYKLDRGRVVPVPVIYPIPTTVPVPVPGSDWDWFATHGALDIQFDLVLKIDKFADQLKVTKEKIDLKSIVVDPKGVRFGFADGIVRDKVLKRFTQASLDMEKAGEVIYETVIPEKLFGMDFYVGASMTQESGFLWVPLYLYAP
ncbi:MAG: hypothetical protein JNL01_16870 [Bdellovibrionales bacterium]|nr:hypothetical protein [Bdellovibrionales bacterium]